MSTQPGGTRSLPASVPALVFGGLSIPLAFMGHLVSLAMVLALLAVVLALVGRWSSGRWPSRYSRSSLARCTWAMRLGILGTLLCIGMWALWSTGVLPLLP